MKRLISNVVAMVMMAAFCLFLIVGNVFRVSVPVVTVPGSYAEQYATKNRLEKVDAPDSSIAGTELRYETFKYNINGNHLTLEQYEGESTELVIPYMIDNKLVTEIGEDFFSYSPNIRKIYLPYTVDSILAEPVKSVEIVVSSDSKLKDDLSEEWNISTYNDSDSVIFSLGDIPFEYSKNEDGYNLVLYTGDDSTILIPAYINGIPVTEVSFNMLGYDLIAFPETINKISGASYLNIYSRTFAVELIFTIVAFVLALLIINMKIGRFRNYDEYALTGPQIVLTFLFFVAQMGFALWAIYRGRPTWTFALLISAIIVCGYILFIFMGETGRTHAKVVQDKTTERTSWMNDMKLSVAHLTDGISDPDVKKSVTRVVEEIKYSDPTTHDAISDVEEAMRRAVDDLISAVARGDKEEIQKQCEFAMKTVKERNEKCKAFKA